MLVSRAPTLEYLSLCVGNTGAHRYISVPDSLFDGSTPRLSCLELQNCDISWKSPLFKGLRYLDIRTPYQEWISVWLDALEEMSQLKRLTPSLLASSIAPHHGSRPSDVARTIIHPSLVYLDIFPTVREIADPHLLISTSHPAVPHGPPHAGRIGRNF